MASTGKFNQYKNLWTHFKVVRGTDYAKCKYCHRMFPYKPLIKNLSQHLLDAHPTVYKNYQLSTAVPVASTSKNCQQHTVMPKRKQNKSTFVNKRENVELPDQLLDHFLKIGKSNSICKYCSVKVFTTSVNLSRHLKLQHLDIYLQYEASRRTTIASNVQNITAASSSNIIDNSRAKRDDSMNKNESVWAHYLQVTDDSAICIYCRKSISYKNTPGNLINHLKTVHKSIYLNKEDDKMETGSVNRSCTETSSFIEIDIVDTPDFSSKTKNTTNEHIINAPINEHVKPVIAFDELCIKPMNEYNEVLIEFENKNSAETLVTSDPLMIPDEKLNSTKSNVESIEETSSEDVADNINEPQITPNTSLSYGDDILMQISNTNVQETNSMFKSKLLDLIWKYFEKVKKSSCKCRGCQQIFPNIRPVPLISHLKGKHPGFYNLFIRDQLLELPGKPNANIHVCFVFQYFKRVSFFTAVCKLCNEECSSKLEDITEHLKDYHAELYVEYNNIKQIDLYEKRLGLCLILNVFEEVIGLFRLICNFYIFSGFLL